MSHRNGFESQNSIVLDIFNGFQVRLHNSGNGTKIRRNAHEGLRHIEWKVSLS